MSLVTRVPLPVPRVCDLSHHAEGLRSGLTLPRLRAPAPRLSAGRTCSSRTCPRRLPDQNLPAAGRFLLASSERQERAGSAGRLLSTTPLAFLTCEVTARRAWSGSHVTYTASVT